MQNTIKKLIDDTEITDQTCILNSQNKRFLKCYRCSKTFWGSNKAFWDGLTKDFYETFWDDLKEIFVNSVREAKEIGHLSTSQKQAIIKLIEKKIDIKDS